MKNQLFSCVCNNDEGNGFLHMALLWVENRSYFYRAHYFFSVGILVQVCKNNKYNPMIKHEYLPTVYC